MTRDRVLQETTRANDRPTTPVPPPSARITAEERAVLENSERLFELLKERTDLITKLWENVHQ